MMPGSPNELSPLAAGMQHELGKLRKEWWWFMVLGILMAAGGTAAIVYSPFATLATVAFFGVVLIVCGAAQLVSAFWAGEWKGFLLSVLIGVLYVVVGGMMLRRPLAAEQALTLVLGVFLLVGGIFRIIASMTLRFQHWGWPLLNGIVTTILGVIIISDLPQAGLFVIGLFLGIDLIFNGWAWIMLSLGLRSLPAE